MNEATFVRFDDALVIDTKKGFHNQYFGARSSSAPGPQAFMVNYDPGIGAPAHFHHVNQFQIFFGTPGCTYQRHEIGPALLHYAQADTLYGPFGAGDAPLRFLTLRQNGNDFTGVMPDNKDLLPRGGHRTHVQKSLAEWLQMPLPAAGEATTNLVLPAQKDGVRAFGIAAGRGTTIAGPTPKNSGGQYYVVMGGSLLRGAEELSYLTVGWCPPDARPPELTAGDEGARLVVLQFPAESNDDDPEVVG